MARCLSYLKHGDTEQKRHKQLRDESEVLYGEHEADEEREHQGDVAGGRGRTTPDT